MKTRVRKYELIKTLTFFEERLSEKFGAAALNEAKKEMIRLELQKLNYYYSKKNMTNIWQIPLKVIFNENGTYNVLPVNENSILIID